MTLRNQAQAELEASSLLTSIQCTVKCYAAYWGRKVISGLKQQWTLQATQLDS